MNKNNLNIIYALRQHDSANYMMCVGALYALGHDDLAKRAESEFPALETLSNTFRKLCEDLDKDYPYDPFASGDAPEIPPERSAEIDRIRGYLDKSAAIAAAIRAEISTIVESLYDVDTINAEAGNAP